MNNYVQGALNNKNVKAFLAMIRQFESASDYGVIYGGSHFTDFSAHPDIKIPFVNPNRAPHADGSPNDWSTAAGAYQINYPTWLTIQAVAFLPDFSASSQDEAAIWLLQTRGSLRDIIAGNFQSALNTASQTWASLPGSVSGQPQKTFQIALRAYTGNGGQLA